MITRSFSPVPEIHTGLGQSGHDRNRLVPDTRKVEQELGVKLRVPLQEALQRTITWYRLTQNL
jgi:nucleoside-diphosphate-sugar epimerase